MYTYFLSTCRKFSNFVDETFRGQLTFWQRVSANVFVRLPVRPCGPLLHTYIIIYSFIHNYLFNKMPHSFTLKTGFIPSAL